MVGDVYRWTLFQQIEPGGEWCTTRLHFLETLACTDTLACESLALKVNGALLPKIAAAAGQGWHSRYTYTCKVKGARSIPDHEVAAYSGAATGNVGPPSAGVIFTLYSGNDADYQRGQCVLPIASEFWSAAGLIADGAPALYEEIRVALMGTYNAIGPRTGQWRVCLYSNQLETGRPVIAVVLRPNLGARETRRQRPRIAPLI